VRGASWAGRRAGNWASGLGHPMPGARLSSGSRCSREHRHLAIVWRMLVPMQEQILPAFVPRRGRRSWARRWLRPDGGAAVARVGLLARSWT
jgi:hypothetical protein